MINEIELVDAFKNEPSRIKFQKATVDPLYAEGNPRLLFDGETSLSTKGYPYLKSYTPVASERVVVLNGVILGGFTDAL